MGQHQQNKSGNTKTRTNSYPFWSPRFWHGMQLGDFLKLLASNRFRVDISRWPMATGVAFWSTVNSILGIGQRVFYGQKIARCRIEKPPVFVVGHWRSGTTLTHELLSLDDQFGFPSTYDCFCPHHFLITRKFCRQLVDALLPKQRPMDNMANGADLPQEDEFALCALGAPTPYFRVAFPNEPVVHTELFNMEEVEPAKLKRFRRALTHFLRALTWRDKKQLILKSPPHTGRIAYLAKWFSGAKFIHISRDPLDVVPSTIRLWRALDQVQGLQVPRYDDSTLHDLIFQGYDLMYGSYFRHADALIESGQLIEIRYEDLVKRPTETVESIYEHHGFGSFERIREKIDQYFLTRKDFRPNAKSLDVDLEQTITDRWSEYIQRYGYANSKSESAKKIREKENSIA